MPQISRDERERSLEQELRVSGLLSGTELARRTGSSQATVHRTLSGMTKRLVSIGATRATRYGLRQNIRNLGSDWPIFRISPSGQPLAFGQLTAFSHGYVFESAYENPTWLRNIDGQPVFDGLPFFLTDIRPQGFIGRAIARAMPTHLGFPTNLRLWNDEDILHYLHEFGSEVPGDLILGEKMLKEGLIVSRSGTIHRNDRIEFYPDKVEKIMAGEIPGSSAGGEQPKFTAWISDSPSGDIYEVIVKFSPPRDTPIGNRWADLLVCEYLANQLLASEGYDVANTDLVTASSRVFLESRRFDRVGAYGRQGVLTAEAIAAVYLGVADSSWIRVARNLGEVGALTEGDVERISIFAWFGCLTANTDMHLGNLSFWFTDDSYPFRPVPLYDMLPMGYAPRSTGELTQWEFTLPPPLPTDLQTVQQALPLAVSFWHLVSNDERISNAFRDIADECSGRLHAWAERFGVPIAS
jgi:hypothetical protein